jgi:hypothetical protein
MIMNRRRDSTGLSGAGQVVAVGSARSAGASA